MSSVGRSDDNGADRNFLNSLRENRAPGYGCDRPGANKFVNLLTIPRLITHAILRTLLNTGDQPKGSGSVMVV